MRINLGGKNHGGATSPRDSNRHQSNRTSPGDQNILCRDFSGQYGVHRVAEGIQNRGVAFGNRRINFPDIADGNDYVLGEAAIGVDADNFYVLANMRLAHATRTAIAAVHVHFGADEIAGLYRSYFRANFFDVAAEFVA